MDSNTTNRPPWVRCGNRAKHGPDRVYHRGFRGVKACFDGTAKTIPDATADAYTHTQPTYVVDTHRHRADAPNLHQAAVLAQLEERVALLVRDPSRRHEIPGVLSRYAQVLDNLEGV